MHLILFHTKQFEEFILLVKENGLLIVENNALLID